MAKMAFWMTSSKCILLLKRKRKTKSAFSSILWMQRCGAQKSSCLFLPDGAELPNGVHISLEKVLVLG